MAIAGRRVIKIGKIIHKSPMAPNILIGKVTDFVEEGTIIYDNNAKRIGIVLETFGPVNSPFIRIKVDDTSRGNESCDIYVIEKEKKEITWRKKPKRKKRYNKGKRK